MRRDEMKTLSSVKGGDEVIFPLTLLWAWNYTPLKTSICFPRKACNPSWVEGVSCEELWTCRRHRMGSPREARAVTARGAARPIRSCT